MGKGEGSGQARLQPASCQRSLIMGCCMAEAAQAAPGAPGSRKTWVSSRAADEMRTRATSVDRRSIYLPGGMGGRGPLSQPVGEGSNTGHARMSARGRQAAQQRGAVPRSEPHQSVRFFMRTASTPTDRMPARRAGGKRAVAGRRRGRHAGWGTAACAWAHAEPPCCAPGWSTGTGSWRALTVAHRQQVAQRDAAPHQQGGQQEAGEDGEVAEHLQVGAGLRARGGGRGQGEQEPQVCGWRGGGACPGLMPGGACFQCHVFLLAWKALK